MSYANNTMNQAPGQSNPGTGGKAPDGTFQPTNGIGSGGLPPGDATMGAGGKGPLAQIPIDQNGNVLGTNQPPSTGTPGAGGKSTPGVFGTAFGPDIMGQANPNASPADLQEMQQAGNNLDNAFGSIGSFGKSAGAQPATDQGANLPQPGTDVGGIAGKAAGAPMDYTNPYGITIGQDSNPAIGPTSGPTGGPLQRGPGAVGPILGQPGGTPANQFGMARSRPISNARNLGPIAQPARPVAQPARPVAQPVAQTRGGRPTPQAIRQQAQAVAPQTLARPGIVAGRGTGRGTGRGRGR